MKASIGVARVGSRRVIHLVSDSGVGSVRRTRAGDTWETRSASPPVGVALGMPTIGAPAAVRRRLPTTGACS